MRNLAKIQSVLFDPPRVARALVRRLKTLSEAPLSIVANGMRSVTAPVRYASEAAVELKRYFSPEQEENLLPRSRLGPWLKLFRGAWIHMRTGETPRSAHVALMALFIRTGGRANDLLSSVIGILHPPYRLPRASGVLGDLTASQLARIERQLETDGYFVFENCLSAKFCESVVRQSLAVECIATGDEITAQHKKNIHLYYDRQNPVAPLYSLTRNDTTDIGEVQQLMSDPSLIAVAQNYLKSKPIFTGIYMGWSASVKDRPDASAAQEFHWDMERIKWLRYFIYLTDVTTESGPHVFIRGTHRAGAIPMELLRRGYVRHDDKTIMQIYGKDAHREFIGLRGTIIAEDSRGLHKAKMPADGDRLLLAFELSNTTFGANKRHVIRNIRVPRFGEFARKYRRLYTNFDFQPGLLSRAS